MARPLDPWSLHVQAVIETRLRSLQAPASTRALRLWVEQVVGPKEVRRVQTCDMGHRHTVKVKNPSVTGEELVHVLRRMEAERRITRSEGDATSGALWSLKEREGVDA